MADQIFVKPLVDPQHLTSGFDEIRDGGQIHGGIDLVSNTSLTVRAITNGIVVYDFDAYNPRYRWDKDSPNSCGNTISIAHKINGVWYIIRYVHLRVNYVSAGRFVNTGIIVGEYSDAGYSKGAHIHMDARLAATGAVVNIEELFDSLGIL